MKVTLPEFERAGVLVVGDVMLDHTGMVPQPYFPKPRYRWSRWKISKNVPGGAAANTWR